MSSREFEGGSLLFTEWEPDPDILVQDVIAIEEYIDDVVPPLVAARKIAMDDMADRFENEYDPDHIPWAELKPDYLKSKQADGFPDKILTRTGALRDAATSEAAWLILEDILVFNADALPRSEYGDIYGLEHESGRSYTPMPARPFIGLSTEAEEKVVALFERWYEGGASMLYIRSSGAAQTRVGGGTPEGGQFGHKFSPEFE